MDKFEIKKISEYLFEDYWIVLWNGVEMGQIYINEDDNPIFNLPVKAESEISLNLMNRILEEWKKEFPNQFP